MLQYFGSWCLGGLVVRSSELRVNGREFGPGRRTIGQLVLGCNQPPTPTQLPTLCGTGNEYWPKRGDALRLAVKAGWLIPFVDKRVGRT